MWHCRGGKGKKSGTSHSAPCISERQRNATGWPENGIEVDCQRSSKSRPLLFPYRALLSGFSLGRVPRLRSLVRYLSPVRGWTSTCLSFSDRVGGDGPSHTLSAKLTGTEGKIERYSVGW